MVPVGHADSTLKSPARGEDDASAAREPFSMAGNEGEANLELVSNVTRRPSKEVAPCVETFRLAT